MAVQTPKIISDGLSFKALAPVNFDGAKIKVRVQIKTADYTVLHTDSGTIFCTVGDTGAIVFTLPVVPIKNEFFIFFQSVDQNMTVNAGAANTMRTKNDLDADGVVFSTGSNLIGACILVFGDGTYWNVAQLCTNTMTVTT